MTGDDLEEPIITPLVRSLTHQQSILGVPIQFQFVNVIFVAILMMWSGNILMLLFAIPIHFILYACMLYDQNLLHILWIRLRRCPPRSNSFWQADSYKV